ncbi:hypothetical protein [Micavibrio aeruginosavorus]|uniref:hypothetical protein n=1 Tax=Micavibrio aeruginosavorus TaxID=349221 RepID=UPI003F4AAD10
MGSNFDKEQRIEQARASQRSFESNMHSINKSSLEVDRRLKEEERFRREMNKNTPPVPPPEKEGLGFFQALALGTILTIVFAGVIKDESSAPNKASPRTQGSAGPTSVIVGPFNCNATANGLTLTYIKPGKGAYGGLKRDYVVHKQTGVRYDLNEIAQQSKTCDQAFSKMGRLGILSPR